MTEIDSDESKSGSDAALQAATDDLEELRQLLLRAGQGAADPAEVKTALESYWRDHQGALRLSVTGLTEQARVQMLETLYKWRDQVGQQFGTQPVRDDLPPNGPAPRLDHE